MARTSRRMPLDSGLCTYWSPQAAACKGARDNGPRGNPFYGKSNMTGPRGHPRVTIVCKDQDIRHIWCAGDYSLTQ